MNKLVLPKEYIKVVILLCCATLFGCFLLLIAHEIGHTIAQLFFGIPFGLHSNSYGLSTTGMDLFKVRDEMGEWVALTDIFSGIGFAVICWTIIVAYTHDYYKAKIQHLVNAKEYWILYRLYWLSAIMLILSQVEGANQDFYLANRIISSALNNLNISFISVAYVLSVLLLIALLILNRTAMYQGIQFVLRGLWKK
jgi:hypothetical protein